MIHAVECFMFGGWKIFDLDARQAAQRSASMQHLKFKYLKC
jgi:hypothetical protein